MDRRLFLSLPALLATGSLARAAGGHHVDYTPEAFAAARASGEPLLLDFYAPW